MPDEGLRVVIAAHLSGSVALFAEPPGERVFNNHNPDSHKRQQVNLPAHLKHIQADQIEK
jgi:hypothetical protein